MTREEPHREITVLIMGNGRIITCRRHSRADDKFMTKISKIINFKAEIGTN